MTKPQPNKTNEVEKEREGEKERGMFWWPWSRIWREGQGKEGKGREGPEYSTAQWYVWLSGTVLGTSTGLVLVLVLVLVLEQKRGQKAGEKTRMGKGKHLQLGYFTYFTLGILYSYQLNYTLPFFTGQGSLMSAGWHALNPRMSDRFLSQSHTAGSNALMESRLSRCDFGGGEVLVQWMKESKYWNCTCTQSINLIDCTLSTVYLLSTLNIVE